MKRADRSIEKVTEAWKSLHRITFEQGGLEAVFNHVRNLVISTLIIAAGVHATVHGPTLSTLAIFQIESSGYGVAAIGLVLAILNLLDGLHKLARTKTPNLLRVLLIIFYLFFSVRVAQLMFAFRIT
jgi:hypothetical protein